MTAAWATIARPGSTLTRERTPIAAHASSNTLPHWVMRRRLLANGIGDSEATAEHEFGQIERHRKAGHHLGRLGEVRRGKHVRPDMTVQPDQPHRR